MSAPDGLAILNPAVEVVAINDAESITITPVRMGKLGPFAEAVKPVAGALLGASGADAGQLSPLVILDALTENTPAMMRAVSIATGISEQDIAGWLPDQFVRVAVAVVKVNADFFIRHLLPAARQEIALLNAARAAMAGSSR